VSVKLRGGTVDFLGKDLSSPERAPGSESTA